MPIIQSTPKRLVVKSGSTTLTLDRDSGKAVLQRKVLFWNRNPAEAEIRDIKDVKVDAVVDRASGVEVCSTVFVLASGAAWAFPGADKKDAEANAAAVKSFLG